MCGKSQIFLKEFFWRIIFRAGPNPAHVAGLDLATHVAGLDLANPAWLLAQADDPTKPCTRKILFVFTFAMFILHFYR